MPEITAALVKQLREMSGAGMMDCKKALAETDGDLDAAMDWLRTKGIAKAAKKSAKTAAEGLVGVAVEGSKGAAVEVNSQTDFVARNEQFQGFVSAVTPLALTTGDDVEALKAQPYPGKSHNVGEELVELVATIGENMTLRRAAVVEANPGVVASYVHNAAGDNMGKIGVLVALTSEGDAAAVAAFGKKIAMHIAATNPAALSVDELDPTLVERERQVQMEKIENDPAEADKPEKVKEGMIKGRMSKFYSDVVLMEQVFVMAPDGKQKIKDAVKEAAKEIGSDVAIAAYVRLQLGEGIEVEEDDFAAEVQKLAG